MNIIIFSVILSTIAQVYFCGFSLWWVICLITRIMFCTRIMGITIKAKKLSIAEGTAVGCKFLWDILFNAKAFPWQNLLLMIVFVAVTIGLEFLDEMLYVYVVEDWNEDD